MNLKTIKVFLIVATLVLVVIAIFPVVDSFISDDGDSDAFSELWLLGPNQKAGDLPFNVTANEPYTIYVNLANHMGRSEYYLVKVKFRNITQSVEELANLQPSSLESLYEFRFVVDDECQWSDAVNFTFQDVTLSGKSITVGDIIINDKVLSVNAHTSLDSQDNCYYFQLFFELWRYDLGSNDFIFDNQYIGLWFNMTASQ